MATMDAIAAAPLRELKEGHIETGTTAFMFLATALVQFMTPGLAFFYSGMVSHRSTVMVMYQSFVSLGLIFMMWAIFCFSLTFGEPMLTVNGYNLLARPDTYFMLNDVGIYGPLQRASTIVVNGFPGMLFMAYQGMFAVITPALISGAFVDRMRFGPYLIFIFLWLILCYCPLGFWNWGGGWMFQIGAWDFAGGMVVHEAAGFSSLGAMLALGKRAKPPPGHPDADKSEPHSLPLVLLGTGMLWFGWFGFNGGSALTIGGLATIAFVNTQLAPAAAMMAWIALDWAWGNRPTLLGACSGAVCGLVVITPSAGFVQPQMAMLSGVMGALLCFFTVQAVKSSKVLDDTCDTLGVHGVGGFLGTILVGVIADPYECSMNDTAPTWCANPGTVTRSWNQVYIQVICAVVAAVYSAVITYVLLKVMMIFRPVLKTWEEQETARDNYSFGESAYKMELPIPEEEDEADDDHMRQLGSNGKTAQFGARKLPDAAQANSAQFNKLPLMSPRGGNQRELTAEVDSGAGDGHNGIERIIHSNIFTIISTVCIALALFSHSIWNLVGIPDDPGNHILDILMILVSLFFIVEIILHLIGVKSYAGSFFFWADLIGTASMVFEISFLFGSSGQFKMVALSNNAAITRTARAARLGTRAARFLRIMKAMALATGGTEAELHEVENHGGNTTSKSISEGLALKLSEKVSLLTILLVCLMPILHFDSYPVEDYSMKSWAERLEASYSLAYTQNGTCPVGVRTFAETVEEMRGFYEGMNYFPLRLEGFPVDVAVGGLQYNISGAQLVQGESLARREYVARVFVPRCEALRPSCQMLEAQSKGGVYNGYNAKRNTSVFQNEVRAAIYFNFEQVVKMAALTDMLTICMVLVVMIYFSHDITKNLRGILMAKMPNLENAEEEIE
eukprot:TRINITY_DN104793_c0_g1_i1.p1 TRINITY_DN104793_c0_g1~~TRINITY_DN104793_c0_g1_i1.p1  ORF type:complete len:924 (+),score=142.08 TRINITY_DN104793_c0_g1_i1:62-2773(+)